MILIDKAYTFAFTCFWICYIHFHSKFLVNTKLFSTKTDRFHSQIVCRLLRRMGILLNVKTVEATTQQKPYVKIVLHQNTLKMALERNPIPKELKESCKCLCIILALFIGFITLCQIVCLLHSTRFFFSFYF